MSQNQHGAMDGLLDPDSLLLDEDDDSMHNHENAGGGAASASSPKNPVVVCPTSHIAGKFSICGDEFDECESEKQPNDFVVGIPTQQTSTTTTIHHPTTTLYKYATSHMEDSMLPICLSSSSSGYHEIPKDPVTMATIDSHRNILKSGSSSSSSSSQNRKQIRRKQQVSHGSTATPASSQAVPMVIVGRLPSQTTSAQRREDTRP
jgi:hypothetical protein